MLVLMWLAGLLGPVLSFYPSPGLPVYTHNFPYLFPWAPLTAVAELRNFGEGPEIRGRIVFTQLGAGGGVLMQGNVTGLTPGKHGLTIHTDGDLSMGCASLGPHFNPTHVSHGGPADVVRHVGDLGNIEADSSGKAVLSETDQLISLTGIVGRGLVVQSKPDDLGRGGDQESLRTGNSGPPVACAVIGWAQPLPIPTPMPPTTPPPAS